MCRAAVTYVLIASLLCAGCQSSVIGDDAPLLASAGASSEDPLLGEDNEIAPFPSGEEYSEERLPATGEALGEDDPGPEVPAGQLPPNAPPINITWISPDIGRIRDYYPGYRAELPVTVHCGLYAMVTDSGNIVAWTDTDDWRWPVLEMLRAWGCKVAVTRVADDCGLPLDTAVAAIRELESYGYAVTDVPSTFSVSYTQATRCAEGFVIAPSEVASWVTVPEPLTVIRSCETMVVTVVLEMPPDAASPGDRWEFWVAVRDITQTGLVQIEYQCRWQVWMFDA